ncbi:MAG: SEL1-like repeat protein [Acidobacteriia bacterium]|nr:SEL1-like repeat protein [Terriglobia bacterium]
MYEKGQGVPADETGAMRWYRRAAEGGDRKAQSVIQK